MSRRKIHAGSTSQTVPLFIQDTSSTVGAGLGGLVFNTSGLAAKYRREGQSTWTTITLQTVAVGTWTSGGFISDGGPVTGGYEFGVPDAVLASGAAWAEVAIYGATNMLAVLLEFELDAINYQDTVRAGLTALPNTACTTNASLLTSGIGSDQLSVSTGKVLLQSTQTGVTIPTVTTLTNLPSIPNNWLTAAGIAASALNGKGDWLVSSSYPTNFSLLGISSAGHISNVDTLTTYTGNTPQTGDNYARIGAGGAGLTALGDARLAHLDTDVSSRVSATVAPSWWPAHFTNATFVSDGVFSVAALANAPTGGGGSDPWATALPGAYIAGQAGYILGNGVPVASLANNSITTASIANGAITDAKITFPGEAAGRPSTFLAAVRRFWEWTVNKKTRDRRTGQVKLYSTDGTTVLETQAQSTVGSSDQQTQGS